MGNPNDQDERYYKSLTRNMVLFIVFLSVIPLILISAITRHYFQVSYREKVLNHEKLLIAKHRQHIDNFLTERLGALRVQAKSFGLDQLSDEGFLKHRLALLQQEYGPSFVDLGLVDDQGIQIAYAGPYQLHRADYSKAAWFKEATQRDHYISDVFLGLRRLPHLVVAVRQEYHGAKWILRATIDFESFKMLVENMGKGQTGMAFILNREGDFQTKGLTREVLPTDIYVSFLKSVAESSDEVGAVERADDSGKEFLNLMTPLNHGAWVLVHRQSTDEAYADLYAARRSAIAVFFLGVICIVAGGVLVSKRMVRHIAQAAQEKRAISEQLIETGKLASLGELAAGVAHEINNPVGIMAQEAGWMQDLLEEEDLEKWPNLDEFRRCLTRIQNQGRRCKEITHKLLSFARKTDPTLKTAQMNDLVREVVSLSEQRARHGNVKIMMNLQDGLPTVNVSPSEIEQVLLNIINNSLDAIDTKEGMIEITSRAEEDYVVVDMADNGPGIPEANLSKIFEPFFTTKPVGKGTGLGLSICYGIVTKMGGEIKVDSELGTGTTFHLYIPLPDHNAPEV